ncbi:MAG: glycosyltransferase family 4 protein [Candidatus Delongbacteria bacterium]|nr:glycosyltransferase family 4 protein [Candidatus Delongbacteria bacterium]
MKQILILAPFNFNPANEGNKIRVKNLIIMLKEHGFEIDYFYTNFSPQIKEKIPYISNFYQLEKKKVSMKYFFSILSDKCRRFRIKIMSDLRGFNKIDDFYDSEIDKKLNEILKNRNYSHVMIEYVFLSKVLENFDNKTKKIIDTHDVFSGRGKLFKKHGYIHTWFHTDLKNEAIGLNRADIIISIQNIEENFFKKITEKPVITIGHYIQLNNLKNKISKKSLKKSILFVGSSNQVNKTSMIYFINEVLPILELNCNFEFDIKLVGSICYVIEDKNKKINKIGILDDLTEVYTSAEIVINPVLFGTGLKIKNIEALSNSKVLITTSIGAEGLENGINKAFLVADTPDDFAKCILTVLNDQRKKKELENNAYKFMQNYLRINKKNFNIIFNNDY